MKHSVYFGLIMLFVLLWPYDVKAQVDTGSSKEIELPFNHPEYQTDGDYFRAAQSGESSTKATSKKIALINAKAELASIIGVHVSSVMQSYVAEKITDINAKYDSKYYELSNVSTAQLLTNVNIIGEKLYLDEEGNFTTWIAIQMSKNEVLNNLEFIRVKFDSLYGIDVQNGLFRTLFNLKDSN